MAYYKPTAGEIVSAAMASYPLNYKAFVTAKATPMIILCAGMSKESFNWNDLAASFDIFLACIKAQTNEESHMDGLPRGFFKVFADELMTDMRYSQRGNDDKNMFAELKMVDVSLTTTIEYTLKNSLAFPDFLPEEAEASCSAAEGGSALHGDISRRLIGYGKDKKEKSFSDFFGGSYKRVQDEPLGDGENIAGVAYLVKRLDKDDNGKLVDDREVVIKVTRKGRDPNEFKYHKSLYNEPKFAKLRQAGEMFIPEVIGEKQTIDEDLEFYVMEYIGRTVGNLRKPKLALDRFKLTEEEMLWILARMYNVLRELHSANFVHLDAHLNNWAFHRTKPYVLFIFDFGFMVRLKESNYHLILEDLWKWTILAYALCEDKSDPSNVKYINDQARLALAEIQGILRKFSWTKQKKGSSSGWQDHMPLDTFRAKNFKEFEASKLVQELDTAVDKWLKTKTEHAINDRTTKLTHWTAAAEEEDKKATATGRSNPANSTPQASEPPTKKKTQPNLSWHGEQIGKQLMAEIKNAAKTATGAIVACEKQRSFPHLFHEPATVDQTRSQRRKEMAKLSAVKKSGVDDLSAAKKITPMKSVIDELFAKMSAPKKISVVDELFPPLPVCG